MKSAATLAAVVLAAAVLQLHAASPEPVFAPNGAVVSSSRLASEAGNTIMVQGGNAIDAAVATFFALAVTLPQAGNIIGRAHCIYFGNDGLYVAPDHRFSGSSIVGADRLRVDSLAAVH